MKVDDYLHFYLGCNTNEGKLVGIYQTNYLIQKEDGGIIAINKIELVKPILRKLRDLNSNEREELNKKGVSIGQRKGYSFTPEAIYYLLSLEIDIFNLIEEELAIQK